MQRIAHTSGTLSSEARDALEIDGVLYLEGVADEERLLAIAGELGEVVAPGFAMGPEMHDGKVYSIKVRDGGRGVQDQHGHVMLSTTPHAFSLHTDGFNLPEPPRYVLLLRADDSSDETPSHVSDSRRALHGVDDELVRTLSEPLFPSADGPRRLIEPTATGTVRFRFNQEAIESWSQREDVNAPIHARASAAAAQLGDRLLAARESFPIAPHDCLVLDNWRVCHGRGAMAPDSERVLQRAWVA
jgi:alpha-ketoglutarate-dependent taurine dioxygenase